MAIWITRPLEDANQLRELIEAIGLEAVVSPLLDVEYLVPINTKLDDVRAIVATSRNGLRGLCRWLADFDGSDAGGLADYKKMPLYVVGEGSGKLAREFGFSDIRTGGGTAESLEPLILNDGYGAGDKVLHVRGNKVAFDLQNALADGGFEFCEVETYRSVEAGELTPEIVRLLHAKELDAVILMSPRTASVYGNLMKTAHMEHEMQAMMHLCFSEQVCDALSDFGVQQVRVMEQTELSHIIDCLKTLYLT